MDISIKIKYEDCNPELIKRVKKSVEKKKIINEYIREGKDLSELDKYGIKLVLPLRNI